MAIDEDSKSVAKLAGIIAVVLLLIVSAVRYFAFVPERHAEDDEANSGSPFVIRSLPSGAQVFRNNEPVGTTPYPYEPFEDGILRIRLEHGDLAPVETLLIVRDDEPVPVLPTFVFSIPVELVSVPPGAQPIVNGRPLRPFEVASFRARASDTLEVAFELGEESSRSVRFNPLTGLMGDADTIRWKWEQGFGENPARLTGIFATSVRVTSDPPGAMVLLDDDPLPIGKTNGRVTVPYGEHRLTLRLPPFDDYVVQVSVGQEPADAITAALQKAVWVAAVDAKNPFKDLNARVDWVRQGDLYVVNPDDRLSTPSNILLGGRPCQIQLSCPGYADTLITLATFASEALVAMHELPKAYADREPEAERETAWVRFIVKEGRREVVPGAEVFGVDKDDGRIVRYGPTDEEGMITTRVPIGDYDWWAAKSGYVAGKPNGERVKNSRKTKEITLKVKPM